MERYEDGRIHLDNLAEDLSEQNDLALKDPERANAMRARLHSWYQETGAKFLRKKGDGPEPWRPE